MRKLASKAEISQFDIFLCIKIEVAKFEISVQNIFGMYIFDSLDDLPDKFSNLFLGHISFALQLFFQILSIGNEILLQSNTP